MRGGDIKSTDDTVSVRSAIANVGSVSDEVACITINDVDYLEKSGNYDTDLLYIAKYPGAAGNSLRISVVDHPDAYSKVINCTSAVANGGLVINAGSNTAKVVIAAKGTGNLDDANNMATAVIADLAVGDLISVGNSTIGYQYLKVSTMDSTSQVNDVASFFNLTFVDPYRLAVNWSANTDINRFWEFYHVVGTAPGQSWYCETYGGPTNKTNDEMHIVVVDDGGYFRTAWNW